MCVCVVMYVYFSPSLFWLCSGSSLYSLCYFPVSSLLLCSPPFLSFPFSPSYRSCSSLFSLLLLLLLPLSSPPLAPPFEAR